MNIADIDTKSQNVEIKEVSNGENKEQINIELPLETSIARMMNLNDSEVGGYSAKLQTLAEYAKQSGENPLWALRDLELRIGTPPLGMKMIDWLSKYAFLRLEQRKLNKELEMFNKQ